MKPSRHLDALQRRVARDFIRASAEGLGVGVAVTRRELITCKARLLGRPVLHRYPLGTIESIWLRRGHSVSFLLVEFVKREEGSLMFLFGAASADDFDAVAAALERPVRPRSSTYRQRQARRKMVLGTHGKAFAVHTR